MTKVDESAKGHNARVTEGDMPAKIAPQSTVMSTEDADPSLYEVLEAWVRTWEELLKEPANLLLERSFANIIQPAIVETNRAFAKAKPIERSANGWGRVLLELLDQAFRDGDPEIKFFSLEFPKQMQDLEILLKKGSFDISAIYPLLERVRNGPSVSAIVTELGKDLNGSEDLDFDRFIAGSRLILRTVLTKHSVSNLKEKLQVSLSRHGTHLAVANLRTKIEADDELVTRMVTAWAFFIDECLSFDLTSVKSDLSEGLTGLFKLYSWDFKARHVLRDAAGVVAKVIRTEKQNLKNEDDRVRSLVTQQLGTVLWREYSIAYLGQLFEMPIGGARHESENLNTIGQELGSMLLDGCFEDKQFRHSEPYRPNPVDACCSDAFVETIKNVARDKFASVVKDDSIPHNFAISLVDRLWDDAEFQQLDWDSVSDQEIEEVCLRWISNLAVQKRFLDTLAPLNSALNPRFRELLSDARFVSVESWVKQPEFWSKWHINLSRFAPWNRGIFHYVPWELFDNKTTAELFARVAHDFIAVDDDWVVIFSIDNLKPPGTPKRIAEITFYDPRLWDYGEKVSFSGEDSDRRTSAKVNVRASTFLDAKRMAASQLRDVLNCMALSLSINKMWGGFKPIIDSDIFAHRKTSGGWSLDRPLIRNERPITQSFVNFERFGPMFDFLIKASRSATATMLQEKLLKALHWYSKARWEQEPAQSLLFYWIALEHLFDEGNDERLLDLIASLHVNWRTVLSHGWYFLSRHQDEVMKKLAGDDATVQLLMRHDNLKNWKTDYRVLLNYQNVTTLLDLIPSEKQALKDYVSGYAEYLHGFVSGKPLILRDMDQLRDRFRFRLLIIKQIRNEIVHRAISDENNVDLYTDELEEIFEKAIVKLTNDAIRQVPQCSSIKDLIMQYEEMWIS